MKHALAILCLTIAVLFGSAVCISTTSASEFIQSRFGKVTLNLPYPNDLCLLGQSQMERVLRKHQSTAQRQLGNKFLAMWVDCEWQKTLQGGALQDWVIIVAGLSGTPKREQVYPLLSPDEYLKMMAKGYGEVSINKIMDKVSRSLEEANSIYLSDRNAVSVTEPIDLGVVDVEDSVHTGMIFNVKTKSETMPVVAINSASLIKGVPVYHYFYKHYKGKKTFKNLLQKAKYYTAKIIHAN